MPGLNQELFDAADAFVGWCNAAGGILGRKIVLHKRDAALTQVAAKMIESCNAPDFMLAGNGEALDATGVQQRLSCKLPEIAAYDVSAAAGTAPLSIDPIPVPNNMSNLGGAWRALANFDPSVKPKYGLISSNQQSIKDSGNRDKAAAEVRRLHQRQLPGGAATGRQLPAVRGEPAQRRGPGARHPGPGPPGRRLLQVHGRHRLLPEVRPAQRQQL